MGKPKNQTDRVKGSFKASSSSRAADLLASSSGTHTPIGLTFSSFSPTFQNPEPSESISWDGISSEVSLLLKKLAKRHAVTKIKALEDLLIQVRIMDKDELTLLVPVWAGYYQKLTNDLERKARSLANHITAHIANVVGKGLAPHLKQLLPAWLSNFYDPAKEIADTASTAFKTLFPTRKINDVLLFAQQDLLKFLDDVLLHQSQTKFSDVRFYTKDEASYRFAKLITCTLGVLTFMMENLSKDKLTDFEDRYQELLSSIEVLSYLHSEEVLVRRAGYKLVIAVVKHHPALFKDLIPQLALNLLGRCFLDKELNNHAVMLDAVLVITKEYPEIWLSAKKPAFKKLITFVTDYSAPTILPYLSPLLSSLPASVLTSSNLSTLVSTVLSPAYRSNPPALQAQVVETGLELLSTAIRRTSEGTVGESDKIRGWMGDFVLTIFGGLESRFDACNVIINKNLEGLAKVVIKILKLCYEEMDLDVGDHLLDELSAHLTSVILTDKAYPSEEQGDVVHFNLSVQQCCSLLVNMLNFRFDEGDFQGEMIKDKVRGMADSLIDQCRDLLNDKETAKLPGSSYQFAFICYAHWYLLPLLDGDDQERARALVFEIIGWMVYYDLGPGLDTTEKYLTKFGDIGLKMEVAKKLGEVATGKLAYSVKVHLVGYLLDKAKLEDTIPKFNNLEEWVLNMIRNLLVAPEIYQSTLPSLSAILAKCLIASGTFEEGFVGQILDVMLGQLDDLVKLANLPIPDQPAQFEGELELLDDDELIYPIEHYRLRLEAQSQASGIILNALSILSPHQLVQLEKHRPDFLCSVFMLSHRGIRNKDSLIREVVNRRLDDIGKLRDGVVVEVGKDATELFKEYFRALLVHTAEMDTVFRVDAYVDLVLKTLASTTDSDLSLVWRCAFPDSLVLDQLRYATLDLHDITQNTFSHILPTLLFTESTPTDNLTLNMDANGITQLDRLTSIMIGLLSGLTPELAGKINRIEQDVGQCLVSILTGSIVVFHSELDIDVMYHHFTFDHSFDELVTKYQIQHDLSKLHIKPTLMDILASIHTSCSWFNLLIQAIVFEKKLYETDDLLDSEIQNQVSRIYNDNPLLGSSLLFVLVGVLLNRGGHLSEELVKLRDDTVEDLETRLKTNNDDLDQTLTKNLLLLNALIKIDMPVLTGGKLANLIASVLPRYSEKPSLLALLLPLLDIALPYLKVVDDLNCRSIYLTVIDLIEQPNLDSFIQSYTAQQGLSILSHLSHLAGTRDSFQNQWNVFKDTVSKVALNLLLKEGDKKDDLNYLYRARLGQCVVEVIDEKVLLESNATNQLISLVQSDTFELVKPAVQLLSALISASALTTEVAPESAIPPALIDLVNHLTPDHPSPLNNLLAAHLAFSHLKAYSFRTKTTTAIELTSTLYNLIEYLITLLEIDTNRPFNPSQLDLTQLMVTNLEQDTDVRVVGVYVFSEMVATVPSIVRSWWAECGNKGLSAGFENYISKHFSPDLISQAMHQITRPSTKLQLITPEFTYKVNKNEVVVEYQVDDHSLQFQFKVPQTYPLKQIEVDGTRHAVVNERRWRAWVMGASTVLVNQNGNLLDSLTLLRTNLSMHFAGAEDCTICYSIIGVLDSSLPNKTCRTCKHKFHAACLYKWFKTSNNASCPLCRNLF